MCLNINDYSVAETATEDIVVYKYLHQNIKADKSLGALRTPYKKSLIKIGNTYKSELVKINNDVNDSYITKGLHSFATLYDCRNDSNSWAYTKSKPVLVKCIIPKGSSYYVGEFVGDKSYASDVLKYVEIIN